MKYLEWNNTIAKYFFNESKNEKEIFLFITKNEIINLGKKAGVAGSDEEIFSDYIQAIKDPFGTGKSYHPIKGAIIQYATWKLEGIETVDHPYPLYIAYLVLFILPLSEKQDSSYSLNGYYGPLNDFLIANQIIDPNLNQKVQTRNFLRIDALWHDLEDWSISEKNTELGYLEIRPFKNKHWVHVGLPLSQSIISPAGINNMPQFFNASGLAPYEKLSINKCRGLLVDHGKKYLELRQNDINIISEKNNELGQSLIRYVITKYREWNGETDKKDHDTGKTKKGFTYSRLMLCCEYDSVNEKVKFFYRLYSNLDYPEDLEFYYNEEKIPCTVQRNEWSRPLPIPFNENLVLKDSLNKWITKFEKKDIRILIPGTNYYLSGWLEADHLSANSKMLLLINHRMKESIEMWGGEFETGNFKKIHLDVLPENYHIYECENPDIPHPDIDKISFKSEKRILWKGGVKISGKTFLPPYLPDIEIENGLGNEKVLIDYGDDNKIDLIKKPVDLPIWEFPNAEDLISNTKFNIRVSGETVSGEKLKGLIYHYPSSHKSLDRYTPIKKRDIFGEINNDLEENYIIGLNAGSIEDVKILKYIMFYTPVEKYEPIHEKINILQNDENDILLYFLSEKETCKSENYYEAFETVYYEKFDENQISNHKFPLANLKRWSLANYSHLGFIDFDYSARQIIINSPQLVSVPTTEGRKVIYIGYRNPNASKKFLDSVSGAGFKIIRQSQDKSSSSFLLPDTISISASHDQRMSFMSSIAKICSKHNVEFHPNKFPAFELAEQSGSLEDYEKTLIPIDSFISLGWKASIFDISSLQFRYVNENDINDELSLVEFKLNQYKYYYVLYMDGKKYKIDKSWGRYFILNRLNKNIVKYIRNKDNKNFCYIIVPATVPFPTIINRALILCSGNAPQRGLVNNNGSSLWVNIYGKVPFIFSSNYLKKIGQSIDEYKKGI